MNPMHQLTRRPVKAAFGALLLALAGVILALSGGQFWAAVQTRAGVEETYTTVAVVTGGLKATSPGSPTVPVSAYEADNCLMRWAREGWSVIRGQATMGLAGGYSPKLTPLTTFYRTDLGESDTRIDSEEHAPYNFAILEIEITEAGEESIYSQENLDDVYSEKNNYFFSWEITGKVVGVQAMSGDWDDPTGRNTHFYLQIDGSSDAEGKALQAGQRILVFAHHYRDMDFEQRCRIARDLEWATGSPREIDPRSLDIENNLIRYADRTNGSNITDGEGKPWPDDAPMYRDPDSGKEILIVGGRLGEISFNVTDRSQPWALHEFVIDEETGEGRFETTGFFDYGAEYDQASFTVLPEGVTAEEMITSSPTWQKAMESIRVSSHSVPVLAVNHLEAMADFAAGTAMVTHGRSFSQKEYSSGAPVCLISESLAR